MDKNLSAPAVRCSTFPWCAAPHVTPDSAGRHLGMLAEFAGLSVGLLLLERPGDEPDEVYVRLLRSAGNVVRTYDITPQSALDWAELLGGIDVRDLAGVTQALYRAGVVLRAIART